MLKNVTLIECWMLKKLNVEKCIENENVPHFKGLLSKNEIF